MSTFQFKEFTIQQSHSALKVGTDAMILGSFIDSNSKKKGLDIGTGTGVLSLMIAQNNPEIQIDAIEIDEGSFADCVTNFINSEWKERLNPLKGNVLEISFDEKYDLIVSNPPFYYKSLLSSDQRIAISKHSFHLPFDKLFEKVSGLLISIGHFWIIVPAEHLDLILRIGRANQLFLNSEINIFAKPGKHSRSVLSFSKIEIPAQHESITIRNENGYYSEQYIQLTKDFHFKKLG